ncbi:hypothetical protein [Nocardia sp. NPDC052316]|uniref:hypothetical protein n=1 Tax=Nocardia sp. NPDC052316 TaxID=3364329 RepID=UPI0037CB1110
MRSTSTTLVVSALFASVAFTVVAPTAAAQGPLTYACEDVVVTEYGQAIGIQCDTDDEVLPREGKIDEGFALYWATDEYSNQVRCSEGEVVKSLPGTVKGENCE